MKTQLTLEQVLDVKAALDVLARSRQFSATSWQSDGVGKKARNYLGYKAEDFYEHNQ